MKDGEFVDENKHKNRRNINEKLLALILVSMIIIMTSVNVTYATELCESEKEYIVSSKYKRTLTTIDDVDELMDEVTQATICNNENL